MIEIAGLQKRMGDRLVASELSLVVPAGSRLAIEGPSGSGKTTLLRMIAGLEHPDRGEIRLAGRRADAGLPPYRRGIGFLFQSSSLWPHLSVAENIGFALSGLSSGQRRQRVRELLQQLGLAAAAHRDPSTLSGGEARRVSLARALADRPRILLLDEPTSNLDAASRQSVMELILSEWQADHTTIVLVSHDPEEVEQLADRRLQLVAGQLRDREPPWVHPGCSD